jgi:hypothetical protein
MRYAGVVKKPGQILDYGGYDDPEPRSIPIWVWLALTYTAIGAWLGLILLFIVWVFFQSRD